LNYKFISSINKQKKKLTLDLGFSAVHQIVDSCKKNKKDRNFRQIRNDPDEN
jgi:hypothetical protein